MKIASEQQLNFIRTEYKDFLQQQTSRYIFEGFDKSIFDNLILFTDDTIYNKIKADHYLVMTDCERVWNEYFWYLRYSADILKIGGDTGNHVQPISKILEKLYNSCNEINDNDIEPFVNFSSNFDSQEYIIFDYFQLTITEKGVSLKSSELHEIVNLLTIENFDFEEIDNLIEVNIDNSYGELLTFRSLSDPTTFIKIDTFSASEDQIHPIDILIRCKFEFKEKVDELLVGLWTKVWKNSGPFVAISTIDKFDNPKHFVNRKRVEK